MRNRGFTLIEILIVVGLIGLMMIIAVPRVSDGLRRQAVKSARSAVVTMHAKARAYAIQRGLASALVISGNTVLVVSQNPVTLVIDTVGAPENLADRYGVVVTTTRDTLAFDPRGIGTASGPTEVSVSSGSHVESIEINAAGRVIR